MSYEEKHFTEGISRKLVSGEFVYYYINTGAVVTGKDLERIKKLRIPPAWVKLWISRDPHSAIQAIGVDAKGRKQYRYHQVHIETAEREKFLRMHKFIKAIPRLQHSLTLHDKLPMYDKNRVLALMLHMVLDYHLRVGKEVYAKKYRSYGVSSLRKRHVKVTPTAITLRFKGKSNQRLHFTIKNTDYIKAIKMLMKLEGDHLFQYITVDNYGREKIMNVSDKDLNDYIKQYMGDEFTMKDFRTYSANLNFITALLTETKKRTPKDRKTIKRNIVNAIKSTAHQLRHSRAVSKKSYVMNFAIELYQNNPDYFVRHKQDDPTQLLLTLSTLYKRHILSNKKTEK